MTKTSAAITSHVWPTGLVAEEKTHRLCGPSCVADGKRAQMSAGVEMQVVIPAVLRAQVVTSVSFDLTALQ
jgi:hypothetical protein